ncbi:2-nitropropane dioxygenase [Hyaloraphidium curvatum]|nr:2-nitropropane dioxygenase [Hyaloraphidium curvatum]
MNVAAGPELAAAVTNAGGMGVIGGVGYTPDFLRRQIAEIKENLVDKNAPFGVDLLLPQVGGNARATNYDYTGGKLPELIDIIIEGGAKLFVSAVGIPPKWAVDKLHKAGIPVMNMIGAPKHALKAIEAGCDIICAQGGEGGGHTGDVSTAILIPKVVDICKGHKSPLTGEPVYVIAAGGIYDGRGLAMALALGAQAVWVGTRFVASVEAGAPPRHKQAVVNAGVHDTVRTIIFTGRPMRVLRNAYIADWEENKADQIKKLTSSGVIPVNYDMERMQKEGGGEVDPKLMIEARPLLMGQVAGVIDSIKPAKEIIDEMVSGAAAQIRQMNSLVVGGAKL